MIGLMLSSGSYTKTAPRPGVTIQIGAPILCQCMDAADWWLRFDCSDNLDVIFIAAPFLLVLKLAYKFAQVPVWLRVCILFCCRCHSTFTVLIKGSRLNWNCSAFILFHAPLWLQTARSLDPRGLSQQTSSLNLSEPTFLCSVARTASSARARHPARPDTGPAGHVVPGPAQFWRFVKTCIVMSDANLILGDLILRACSCDGKIVVYPVWYCSLGV